MFAQVVGAEAFARLGEPRPGEWLWHFREPGQTLQEYARSLSNRKSSVRDRLHLLPFADLSRAQRAVVPALRRYLALFFDLTVVPLSSRAVPTAMITPGRGQLDAQRLARSLTVQVPPDSLGLLGLVGGDLHALGLNFVFGVGLFHARVAVHSLHRYGRARGLLLLRACKVATHELGHVLGLAHCVFFRCAMNGTNSLAETDRAPLHLCPVCLAKLHHNLRFDPVQRYRRLAAYYARQGWTDPERFVRARAGELARARGHRP